MPPLPTRLIHSIRLAATAGRGRPPGEMSAALEDGRWAAKHAHTLPPFVILDVRSVLNDLASGRALSVPQRTEGLADRCSDATSYDEWLADFARQLHRRLGRVALQFLAETAREGQWSVGPHLPPLMAAWPNVPDSRTDTPRDWDDAYRFLAADPNSFRDGWTQWNGSRSVSAEAWHPWPPVKPAEVPTEPLLWGRFAADRPTERLHQEFDHAAADIYLRAADPPPQHDLEARLQGERETLSPVDQPFAESVEEQHPFVGVPTTYTYTLGEYGVFKLVNRSDPRLSTPPRASRPRPFELHLAWAVGYRGLRASQGSVLQAAVALLLDDWRAVLAKHRLTFHLHRFGATIEEWKPRSGSPVRAILPGRRWKAQLLGSASERRSAKDDSDPTALVPPGVIGLLFRRPSAAETISAGPVGLKFPGRDEPVPDPKRWWCGVLLREELEADLGFEFTGTTWSGPSGELPRVFQHVIVIDPARRVGRVCRVEPQASRTVLRPLGEDDDEELPKDYSFLDLRTTAVRAVADVIFDLAPV